MARYKQIRQKIVTRNRNISPKPSMEKRGSFVGLKCINAPSGARVEVPPKKTTEMIPRVVIERLSVQPGQLVKCSTNKTEGKIQTKSKRQRKQENRETEISARDQDSEGQSSSIAAPSTGERFPAELVNGLKKNERLISIRKRTVITQTLIEENGQQYMIESRSMSSDIQILDKN